MIGLVSLVLKDPAALFWLTVVPPGQGTDKGGAGLLLKLSAVPISPGRDEGMGKELSSLSCAFLLLADGWQ